MRCVLHIGRPKTGSAAIQRWLQDNAEILRENGYALSRVCGQPINTHLVAYFGEFQFGLHEWRNRHDLDSGVMNRNYLDSQGFLEEFEAEVRIAQQASDTFILTCEHLSEHLRSFNSIKVFTSYLSTIFESIQVVAYVRPQTEMVPSWWSTGLKSGMTSSLSQFLTQTLNQDILDYYQYAESWSSASGAGNSHFFWYQSSQDWDVRKHFADNVLRLPTTPKLNFPPTRANEALGKWEAEGFRWINHFWPLWIENSTKRNPKNLRLREILRKRLHHVGPPLSLNQAQRQRVRNHFSISNEQFDQQYRSGDALSDFS